MTIVAWLSFFSLPEWPASEMDTDTGSHGWGFITSIHYFTGPEDRLSRPLFAICQDGLGS
jgi:hypothetical protein